MESESGGSRGRGGQADVAHPRLSHTENTTNKTPNSPWQNCEPKEKGLSGGFVWRLKELVPRGSKPTAEKVRSLN